MVKSALLVVLISVGSLSAQEERWLLRNVHVVDVTEGRLMDQPQDLVIAEGRIKTMAPAGSRDWNPGLASFNAEGKYLIPGLWDMHAHPDDPEVWRLDPEITHQDQLMPQFVLNGVTGIRDMAGSLALVQRWRRLGAQGDLIVPKIFACGPLLDGPSPMWDGSVGIKDSNQVKPVVDSLIQAGADFLKVYSLLPRDLYFKLSEYASEKGITMVGHVPLEVLPSEAAASGMKSQEHLLEILQECSSIKEDVANGTIDYGGIKDRFDQYLYRQNLMLDTFDEKRLATLIEVFLKHDTWHTPTLSMWYKNAWFEQELVADADLWPFLPPYLKKYWTVELNDHLKYRDNKAFLALKRRLYEYYEKIVRSLHSSGVKLLAGTDVGANPLCWPGVGVHNELQALVAAGISPEEALKTATINPALFLEIEKEYGSVEEGKIADLVLLEANPLQNIEAVRGVWGVIKDGVFYNSQVRSQKLEEIKAGY